MTAVWSSINNKLVDRLAVVSAPALVFWLGGLLAWSLGNGGLHALARPASWLSKQSGVTQAAVLFAVLAGVSASGLMVARATLPALRLLEGYWPSRPRWIASLRGYLVGRVKKQATEDLDRWQELKTKPQPTDDDLAEVSRLELAMHRRPNPPGPYQPTRIGNLLRAAEGRPRIKYGLDAVTVWPQLWLVLPTATQQELTAARTALDGSVAAAIWGILFCAFTPWTIFALPAGLIVAAAAVRVWLPARAADFGSLVVAAFDLHRVALYQQLRWPLPDNPADEIAEGRRLTEYLWRGSDRRVPSFTQPVAEPGG
jgi:hypothetical protein